MQPTKRGHLAMNDAHQKKFSDSVSSLFSYIQLQVHIAFTFTAEEHQEKENSKRQAVEQAELRKKKKETVQQEATQRKQTNMNKRNGSRSIMLAMFLLHFAS